MLPSSYKLALLLLLGCLLEAQAQVYARYPNGDCGDGSCNGYYAYCYWGGFTSESSCINAANSRCYNYNNGATYRGAVYSASGGECYCIFDSKPASCPNGGSSYSASSSSPCQGVVTGIVSGSSTTYTCLGLVPNKKPVANNDAFTVAEDSGATTLAVIANDSDPDPGDSISLKSVTQPANGAVTRSGNNAIFTPAANFAGSTSFTYVLRDAAGKTDTATVTVTVTQVNDPPIARNDAFTVAEDSTTTLNLLANDDDIDNAISLGTFTQPANAAVTKSGNNVVFTPNANWFGVTTFTYTLQDAAGATDTATVTVTVNSVNDAPVATNNAFTVDEDSGATTFNVIADDDDVESAVSLKSVTQPANAAVTKSGNNVVFTPNANFAGSTSFSYTIEDAAGATDSATVTVTVTPVNDPPVATNNAYTVDEDSGATTLNVMQNDIEIDAGDVLTLTTFTQPANAAVTKSGNNLVFTPNANWFGVTSFTYNIRDSAGATDGPATVTVTVNAVNDAPVAVNDAFTVAEDSGADTFTVLDNDSDVEGAISLQSVTQPANAAVTISGDAVVFTPDLNFAGTTTFTYTVADAGGLMDTATVTVTVTQVNDLPIARNDAFTVTEDSGATTLNLLANDEDVDDTILLQSFTQPANAAVTRSGNNVVFTPNANWFGVTSFTYTIAESPNGATDTATVTVTVESVNDAPVAANDAFTVAEDSGATTFTVLDNDSDVEGAISLQSVTQPANAAVTISGDAVVFTPNSNWNGATSFTYTIADAGGLMDTATVSMTVNAVNDAPIATNDAFSIDEESGTTLFAVLDNDSEVDDGIITIKSVTQPINGVVAISGSQVSFTANANFVGQTSFTYTIEDSDGLTDTAVVLVNVAIVNDAPVANNDAYTVAEDSGVTALNVMGDDTDADTGVGDSISLQSFTQPANALITQSGNQLMFTPNANFNGVTTFQYTIVDTFGATDSATVTITVTPVNDAPIAVDDAFTVAEDSGATLLDVLPNDSDIDNAISLKSVTQPANGAAAISGGEISFTPAANFNGQTSFSYTIEDAAGATDTATVTVTVSAVNDAPNAVDASFTVVEDSSNNVLDIIEGDSDVDAGDSISLQSFTQPANGAVVKVGNGVIFTPNPNFDGVTTFQYTIVDTVGATDTATVTITVTPVNDAPIAVDDAFTVAEDSGATLLDVLPNDSDIDNAFSLKSVTQPANGAAAISGGEISFTPAANFAGSTSFSYTIEDASGATDTATVTVTVSAVNDAPNAVDASFTVDEDSGTTTFNIMAGDSDVDAGDSISLQSFTQPANGALTKNGNQVIFTPNDNFDGVTTFQYTIVDTFGATDTATVTITVTPVNDAPIAVDDAFTVAEDSGATLFDVLPNDSDIDNAISLKSVTQPSNGAAAISGGEISFTPAANFDGQTSFSYTIEDAAGATDTATVTVTVTPVDDAPTANSDSFSVLEDSGETTFDILANDVDVDSGDVLSLTTITTPENGSLRKEGNNVVFTPNENWSGSTSFFYTIEDSTGRTDSTSVSVTVVAVNDAPVAVDDSFEVMENSGATLLAVLPNDSDVDEGDSIRVTAVTQPNGGSTVIDGDQVVEFTPDNAFTGPTTFTYTISDTTGATATATVSMLVKALNQAPVAVDDAFSVNGNTAANLFTVLENDSDPDVGDIIQLQSLTAVADGNGEVEIAGGRVSFTPRTDFEGTTSFSYTIADTAGATATATVQVTVLEINHPPTAVDDTFTVGENTGLNMLNILNGDYDEDGDTITLVAVSQPEEGGTVKREGADQVIFTPAADWLGESVFTYTIEDTGGFTAIGTVTVSVLEIQRTQPPGSSTPQEDAQNLILICCGCGGAVLLFVGALKMGRRTGGRGDEKSLLPTAGYYKDSSFTQPVMARPVNGGSFGAIHGGGPLRNGSFSSFSSSRSGFSAGGY